MALLALVGTVPATEGVSGAAPTKSLTVLESNAVAGQWTSLDPATDSDVLVDTSILTPIYGALFELSPNGTFIPDLATGYKTTDGGKTVTISLRKGVKFQDGTPFNAQAVAFNFRRDLSPTNFSYSYRDDFPISSITTPNSTTVVLHMPASFPIISAITNEPPDYVASPTALEKMGTKAFGLNPVGAGPFKVVSDQLNSKLVLQRNPNYWQPGHPLVDNLTFDVIGSDESAYDALVSGQAQVYQGLSTFSILNHLSSRITAINTPPAVAAIGVELNSMTPPFNNKLAREAIYYATDPEPINKAVYANRAALTQSPTAPGGLFHEAKVPGYRSFNLTKARALVKQLGGLKFTLAYITTPAETLVTEALKAQWAKAGIDATLSGMTITSYIRTVNGPSWESNIMNSGSFDPALGFGLGLRFSSTAAATGNHDATLNNLIKQGLHGATPAARAKVYKEVFKRISDQAYAPFLFAPPTYTIRLKTVTGPGLSTQLADTLWQSVSVK